MLAEDLAVTTGEVLLGLAAALALGAALGVAMHLSAPGAPRAAPARDRLAGRARSR